MSQEPMFAGIDGGGTKTVVVIVDLRGRERARVLAATSNAAIVGHDPAATVLKEAVLLAAKEANARLPLAGAWFGLSGSDRPEDRRQLQPALADVARSIRFTNDAELILGALPGTVGVALVAGTGSIAFGMNRSGERARAGGWGHIFSDEGSGYDIARKMLSAFALEADGRGPATSLTGRLMGRFALEDPHQIISHVYASTMTKADLAALSVIVFEEANGGDRVASGIISSAAEDMADLAHAVASRLGLVGVLDLAVTGGLFLHEPTFLERVLRALGQRWSIRSTMVVDDPALTAARSLAAQHGNDHD